MPNPIAAEYLKRVYEQFVEVRKNAERTFDQLSDDQLGWAPNEESNSIAVIIKHMAGNMISRWTDLFGSDGEKATRDRDGEFVQDVLDRERLLARWAEGWDLFLQTLQSLQEEDLLRTVTIRNQPHTVLQAIERQMYHYSYHVGQIVYIAKQLKNDQWQTLTIPRKR